MIECHTQWFAVPKLRFHLPSWATAFASTFVAAALVVAAALQIMGQVMSGLIIITCIAMEYIERRVVLARVLRSYHESKEG